MNIVVLPPAIMAFPIGPKRLLQVASTFRCFDDDANGQRHDEKRLKEQRK